MDAKEMERAQTADPVLQITLGNIPDSLELINALTRQTGLVGTIKIQHHEEECILNIYKQDN